jgi:hypothetical protein
MCAMCGIPSRIPETTASTQAAPDRTRFAAFRNVDCRNYLVGASLSMGGDSIQVWHCLVLLSTHGLAGAIRAPDEQLMLHDLAGPETRPSAVRLNS